MARSSDEASLIAERAIQLLEGELPIAAAVLFGSYAEGTPHDGSDIDLAVFTSDESRLNLKGSRGETLNFQLKLKLSRKVPGCQTLKLDEFKKGPAPTVRFFEMRTMNIEHPSYTGAKLGKYFDPLVPLLSGNVCTPSKPGGSPDDSNVETWIF